MAESLTSQTIANTYKGVIHADTFVPASGTAQLFDGAGNMLAMSIGRSTEGVAVSGGFTLGNIIFPTVCGSLSSIMCVTDTNTLGFKTINELVGITAGVTGTFNHVKSITFTNGVATQVLTGSEVKTLFIDLETFDDADLISAGFSTNITSNNTAGKTIYPYGQITNTAKNIRGMQVSLIKTNYLDLVWNGAGTVYGDPIDGDNAIVVVSSSYSQNTVEDDNGELNPNVWAFWFVRTSGQWAYQKGLSRRHSGANSGQGLLGKYAGNQSVVWHTADTNGATTLSPKYTIIGPNTSVKYNVLKDSYNPNT